jgi:hypothetical protein
MAAEVHFAPLDAALELRGGYQWRLTSPGLWSVSAQLGGDAVTLTRGPADLGLGPFGGLSVGLGSDRLEVFLGGQAGGEIFVRGPGVRFPLRLVLGARARWGGFMLDLVGRAGADLEPGLYPTGKAELALLAGWAF